MAKTLVGYLQKQRVESGKAAAVQVLLTEWRESSIPIWPAESKRDEERMAVILGRAMMNEAPVRFLAPVCPDYPKDSAAGQLGIGIGATIPPVLSLMYQLRTLLEKHGVPHHFQVLLADTEVDILEIVHLLAGSQEEFYRRCNGSVAATKQIAPDCKITTFSDFFGESWFLMQYFWENIAKGKFGEDQQFHTFLLSLAFARTEKYEKQFGRQLSCDQRLAMAIRHYAQYHTIGYWLRQYPSGVLVNADSPNLRAIRRPFIIPSEQHPVCLKVRDQNQRVPIIVP